MNFIFDIGNVLIHFKPEQFLQGLFHNPVAEQKMNALIFRSNEWVELDAGVISAKEARERFCAKDPESKELIDRTMEMIPSMLTPIDATVKILPEVKALGHKLYYLSNYQKELCSYIQSKYSFFELFDGGVFSCDVHMLKPAAEIYQFILGEYGLDPRECVFFDDIEPNVIAAEGQGIRGVLFTDVKQVTDFIESAVK